jgi:hypothetical protein
MLIGIAGVEREASWPYKRKAGGGKTSAWLSEI